MNSYPNIWYPPKDLVNSANVTSFMESQGLKDYKEFVKRSTDDIKWFWGNLPDWLGTEWFNPPARTIDTSGGPMWTKWYIGGTLNITYNTVDRHVKNGHGDRIAFIWQGEDGSLEYYSYSKLKERIDRMASRFVELGANKGDNILLYITMIPDMMVAFYAALKIGAAVAPVFSGFAPASVAERIDASKAKIIVSADGYYRRGKKINLLQNLRNALNLSNYKPPAIIYSRRLGSNVELQSNEYWFNDLENGARPRYEAEEVSGEDIALLMYTSGTTGKPKGIQIRQHGALLMPTKDIYFNMDLKQGDKFFWVTDIGWMMGPWQIIGVNTLGGTHIIIEGAINYPKPTRILDLIDNFEITQFGFAATVARLLKKDIGEASDNYDLSTLRTFGNTGEPIDRDTWMWVMYSLGKGKRPLINLSGGTDMFGPIVLPSPTVPLKPSTLWGPGLGCDVDVFNDEGKPVRREVGYLVIKKPIPSLTWGFFGEPPDRYLRTYWSRFPGVWYHGDWALIDGEGYWFILGRADDVIKVAGKRIGSAEIEDVVNSHPEVAETACIGVPDPIKGEVIACFSVMKEKKEVTGLEEELKNLVVEKLGKPFEPKYVLIVDDLPRTRSGKILRRVIRGILKGWELKDKSILENPESLESIRAVVEKLKQGG
ncbi:MAG: AMP-binding protein [Desulfurococcales archaeon]|nr:AMP-binding protein [Desulfurococcales archaeon]